jgi:hypothetical protein
MINSKSWLFFRICFISLTEKASKKEEKSIETSDKGRNYSPMRTLDDDWQSKNKDTFVCYSCSEGLFYFMNLFNESIIIYIIIWSSGEESWNISGRMSVFGEALSYSICQYACQESLSQILNRVSSI